MSEDDFTADPPVEWQIPLSSVEPRQWDAIVIGAGPSGSTAARFLAGQGHSVLLVDRKHFPREKVCGDCLAGDSIRFLEQHGLYDTAAARGKVLPAARIYSCSNYRFDLPGKYLSVERPILDTMLAGAAVDNGAVFVDAAPTAIRNAGDQVEIEFGSENIIHRARVCLIATGSQVDLAGDLGMVPDPTPYAFALRCYVRSSIPVEQLVLCYHRSILPGYAWIIPVGEGKYNIGCGTYYTEEKGLEANVHQAFESFITQFEPARDLLKHGEMVSRLRGAPLHCALKGANPLKMPNILTTGETIGTTYPFTGEGVGKAMESGQIAAEVIHTSLSAGDPSLLQDYVRRIETELRPKYRGYLVAQRWLTRPSLNDFMARRIASSEFLRGRFTDFVSESGDARRAYAVWSVIQSLWR